MISKACCRARRTARCFLSLPVNGLVVSAGRPAISAAISLINLSSSASVIISHPPYPPVFTANRIDQLPIERPELAVLQFRHGQVLRIVTDRQGERPRQM